MNNYERYFGNIFNVLAVTSLRFYVFSTDALKRLKKINSPKLTDVITRITVLLVTLRTELNAVDLSTILQRGQTLSLDQITDIFKRTMSDLEFTISKALGGKTTPAYLEFYPHGINEYTTATRLTMPLLVSRVNAAAIKYKKALGDVLSLYLQSYLLSWTTSLDSQGDAKVDLLASKTDVSASLSALEKVMLEAMHIIGGMYPGDVSTCATFFNFNLLYNVTHHTHVLFDGVLAAGETKMILNRKMTDTVSMNAVNIGTTSDIKIWLAALETDPSTVDFIELTPAASANFKPSDIGLITNTFLMVKNESAMNVGSYEIDVAG